MPHEIVKRAFEVFAVDIAIIPPTTLRSADAIDSYNEPIPYDPSFDQPKDDYLEKYTFWGHIYLDPASWRYYLPRWIDYAFRHADDRSTMVVEGLIASLRPPDHEPPRLASLTKEQEAVIVSFLKYAAVSGDAIYDAEMARQVLEEWWIPNARYRPPNI